MARRVIEELIDDLDNEYAADETVLFGLDGASYEIDLAHDNAAHLRDAFAPYLDAARKVGGAGRGRRRPSGSANTGRARTDAAGAAGAGPDAKAVRAWATENGIELSSRGRIPAAVLAQYQAAQG